MKKKNTRVLSDRICFEIYGIKLDDVKDMHTYRQRNKIEKKIIIIITDKYDLC